MSDSTHINTWECALTHDPGTCHFLLINMNLVSMDHFPVVVLSPSSWLSGARHDAGCQTLVQKIVSIATGQREGADGASPGGDPSCAVEVNVVGSSLATFRLCCTITSITFQVNPRSFRREDVHSKTTSSADFVQG